MNTSQSTYSFRRLLPYVHLTRDDALTQIWDAVLPARTGERVPVTLLKVAKAYEHGWLVSIDGLPTQTFVSFTDATIAIKLYAAGGCLLSLGEIVRDWFWWDSARHAYVFSMPETVEEMDVALAKLTA